MLQADGGTRCACINAAFMALAAAAVPMRDILASCAAGYLESTALLDLNYVEVCCWVQWKTRSGCITVCIAAALETPALLDITHVDASAASRR